MSVVIRRPKYEFAILLLIIFASAAILFPPYARFFYQDDYKHIDFIRELSATPWHAYKVISPFWIGWNYRPVQHLFFLVNYLLFGTNPLGYYLVLLGLHIANMTLLLLLARQWRVGNFGALCALLAFSLNAVYYDAIGWLSSVSVVTAALFALLAAFSYSRYLFHHRQNQWWLIVIVIASLLSLLSREESLVIPFILFAIWILQPQRQRPCLSEIIASGAIAVGWSAYIYFQTVRPAWGSTLENLNANSLINDLGQFLPLSFTLRTVQSIFPQDRVPWDIDRPFLLVLGLLIIGLLAIWFVKGNRATRLGLLWSAAYLGILYIIFASYDQLLAPRYMYLPWIGISLAIGASFDQMTHLIKRNQRLIRIGIGLLLLVFLTYQATQIRLVYQGIQDRIETMESVRQQLMELVPTPANDSHFFAYALPSTKDFFQAMASVWYDRSFPPPGGSFRRLKLKGNADSNHYLFNYDEGVFYNLMPELQQEGNTTFLWASPMAAQILHLDGSMGPLDSNSYKVDLDIGSPNARRLGIFLHPPTPDEGWSSIRFQATIPQRSDLRFGIRRESGGLPEEDGMTFRIRAVRPSGESTVLFSAFLEPDQTKTESQWTDVSLPMDDYWGETIDLHLEVFAGNNLLHDHGFWANPRFVVDNSAS